MNATYILNKVLENTERKSDEDEINDNMNIDMDKAIDEIFKQIEEECWKDEPKFNEFLIYLQELLKSEKRLMSDSFYYNESAIKYTAEEFDMLLTSLANKVFYYSRKFHLDRADTDNNFATEMAILKVNNKFYKIGEYHGQGSFVDIECTECSDYRYVDYNLMMLEEPPVNYKSLIVENVKYDIENTQNEYSLSNEEINNTLEVCKLNLIDIDTATILYKILEKEGVYLYNMNTDFANRKQSLVYLIRKGANKELKHLKDIKKQDNWNLLFDLKDYILFEDDKFSLEVDVLMYEKPLKTFKECYRYL